jgi:hypothetical protein
LPAAGVDIVFAPWRILRPALSISVGALLLLIAAGIVEHRAEARRLLRAGGSEKAAREPSTDQPSASA